MQYLKYIFYESNGLYQCWWIVEQYKNLFQLSLELYE